MSNTTTPTKKEALELLQAKLASDIRWAQRALLAVYRNQTTDEQSQATVSHNNNMGFRAQDAYLLTSFAGQLQRRGSLSEKQMAIVFRKMPIYARQLMKFYGEKIQVSLQA